MPLSFTANKKEIVDYLCERGYKSSLTDPLFDSGIDRFLWLSFCLAYCSYNTNANLINTRAFIVYSRINKSGAILILKTINTINKKFIIETGTISTNPYTLEQDLYYMCKFVQRPEDYKLIMVNMNPEIPSNEDWPLFIGYPILEEFFKERFKE